MTYTKCMHDVYIHNIWEGRKLFQPWGDQNNTVQMESLQTLENKAAKLILDEHSRYSATIVLQGLNWTTLKTRRHNHRCIFIYKCVNGLTDFHFDLTKNVSIHNHNIRRRNDPHLPRVKQREAKTNL